MGMTLKKFCGKMGWKGICRWNQAVEKVKDAERMAQNTTTKTIVFPDQWSDRGRTRVFKQPEEFLADLTLDRPTNGPKRTADPSIEWISSRRIAVHLGLDSVETVRYESDEWEVDEWFQYYLPYDKAVDVVNRMS